MWPRCRMMIPSVKFFSKDSAQVMGFVSFQGMKVTLSSPLRCFTWNLWTPSFSLLQGTSRVGMNSLMWFTLYRRAGKVKKEPSAADSTLSLAGGKPCIQPMGPGSVSWTLIYFSVALFMFIPPVLKDSGCFP